MQSFSEFWDTKVAGNGRDVFVHIVIPCLPLGEGAARRRRMRGGIRSDFALPHTRQGFALPPSPRRGFWSPKKYVVKFFSFCYNKSIYIKFFFYPMEEPE